ncbi:large conductance mechanosensitive channel protein MscL [Fontivita pretiosa]|uniref:large conductance mechanosensitive channel protein MscL n=1 Tax=Fontivita pretiosa TaxID=2989684 RepID=UPI003D17C69A
MGLLKEFREFAMKGNVVDLAVGVIIGAAFGSVTKSMVEDVLMPPIGKIVGNLDFSNLYISLSDKIDAANAAKAAAIAATQPATQQGVMASAMDLFSTASRLPLAEARQLGPVIAYGNFITIVINFIVVAFCVFLVIKLMNTARRRFEREQAAAAAAPATPPADVQLLTEIRDILKTREPREAAGG